MHKDETRTKVFLFKFIELKLKSIFSVVTVQPNPVQRISDTNTSQEEYILQLIVLK